MLLVEWVLVRRVRFCGRTVGSCLVKVVDSWWVCLVEGRIVFMWWWICVCVFFGVCGGGGGEGDVVLDVFVVVDVVGLWDWLVVEVFVVIEFELGIWCEVLILEGYFVLLNFSIGDVIFDVLDRV